MEGLLPAADMKRWVSARSKPKYAALMMTHIVRTAQVWSFLACQVLSLLSLDISGTQTHDDAHRAYHA